MQCKRFWSIAIAVLILLTAATGYASAQAATPSSTATPTPLPSPPPTSAADPDVQIPAGWKRIEDDRLGYSLAVPFSWLTFDLHSGALDPIAGLLGGKTATDFLREFLDSPEGKNLGILAIEPDITQLFANPPFPPFLNVSTAPWPEDLTAEQLVGFIQNSAENIADVQLHSVMTGAVSGMPALRAVVTANLSGMGFDIVPYVVVTVLRENQTAYILTVATRVQTAVAKQPLIEQIVGTFRPTIQAQTEAPPTALPPTGLRSGRCCQSGNPPRRHRHRARGLCWAGPGRGTLHLGAAEQSQGSFREYHCGRRTCGAFLRGGVGRRLSPCNDLRVVTD